MTFLKGYRTYIVSGLLVVVGLVNLLAGELSLDAFLASPDLVILLTGLGFAGLRASVPSKP